MVDSAASIWRDFVTDGVSTTGKNEPSKLKIREWGTDKESRILANEVGLSGINPRLDAVEAASVFGINWTSQKIRCRSTANVDIATGLQNGDVLNGLTLTTGDHVFLGNQTAAIQNGLFTVVASGGAVRATFADSAAELAHIGFVLQSGSEGTGENWTLPLDVADITLGATALNFGQVSIDVGTSGAFANEPFLNDEGLFVDFPGNVAVTRRLNGSDTFSKPEDVFALISSVSATVLDRRRLIANHTPANSPRIQYDNKNSRLGVLVEPERSNNFTFANDFSNAAWIKASATISADILLSPDGTINADKLVEDSGAGKSPVVYRNHVFTDGSSNSISVYVKAGERSRFNMFCGAVGFAFNVTFDLAAGIVESGTGGRIEKLWDGWYRCSVTGVAQTAGSTNIQFRVYPATGGHPYAGDGTSGLYLYLAQHEFEPSVEKFTFQSEFDNAVWNKADMTVSADVATDPNSTATADKLIEASGAGKYPSLYQGYVFTSGEVLTVKIYAKAAERSRLNFFSGLGLEFNVTFDLTAGTIESGVGGTITSVGNGWYLCEVTAQSTRSGGTNFQFRVYPAAGAQPYTGDGTSGLYVWQASLLSGGDVASPTSPIPTTTTAVTRVADRLECDLSAIPFDSTQGAIYISGRAGIAISEVVLAQLDSGSLGSSIRIVRDFIGNLKALIYSSGAKQAELFLGVVADGDDFEVVLSWRNNEIRALLKGRTIVVDLAATIPSGLNCLFIGSGDIVEHCSSTISIFQLITRSPGTDEIEALMALDVPNRWEGKNLVTLGTSITAQSFYATKLANLLGANLTNLGVGGGSLGANAHSGSEKVYDEILNIPAGTDLITIEAGINDFGIPTPTPLGVIGDVTTATFYGALWKTVVDITAAYPNAMIVFLTPYSSGPGNATYNSLSTNSNGNTLAQFQTAIDEVAELSGWPVIDVGRRSGIGYFTSAKYTSDDLHLNAAGGQRYAEYTSDRLLDLRPV